MKFSLEKKILLTTCAFIIFTALALSAVSLYSSVCNSHDRIDENKSRLLEDKKRFLMVTTQILLNTLYVEYENANRKENISGEEQEKLEVRILNIVKKNRFGMKKQDYFWIHTFDKSDSDNVFMKMHPTVPSLDETDISKYKYPKGEKKGEIVYATGESEKVPFFVQMNKVVAKTGDGYVCYEWPKPTKNGLTEHRPKCSYVILFKELNWIIGTGIYIDDLDELTAKQKQKVQDEITSLILGNLLIVTIFCVIAIFLYAIVIKKTITKPVQKVVKYAENIAQGNLNIHFEKIESTDELGVLMRTFKGMASNMKDIILRVKETSSDIHSSTLDMSELSINMERNSGKMSNEVQSITSSSSELTTQSESVSKQVKEVSRNISSVTKSVEVISHTFDAVAASSEQASATMEEISRNTSGISIDIVHLAGGVDKLSTSLADISNETKQAMTISSEAQTDAETTVDSMRKLESASNAIKSIVEMIQKIASQTNMLALNATIEAAGAGNAGKGFSVVAAEVKELANRTTDASNEVEGHIAKIQELINVGLTKNISLQKVVKDLFGINSGIEEKVLLQTDIASQLNSTLDSIANSSQENAAIITQVSSGLSDISRSNSDVSETVRVSYETLLRSVSSFKEIAELVAKSSEAFAKIDMNLHQIREEISSEQELIQNFVRSIELVRTFSHKLVDLVAKFNTQD